MTTSGVQPNADVADDADLGDGTRVWHLAQIREDAVLGANCTIGRGAYVGSGVRMGANCKVQNYALVYEPAVLEDGVFVGPAAVLTNDQFPRAVTPDGERKIPDDWERVGVTVRRGASIGAGAICVAPLTIGEWALIAAGAVVVDDVPAFALMAGVPARRVGWVGQGGWPLQSDGRGSWHCARTQQTYTERAGGLELDSHPHSRSGINGS